MHFTDQSYASTGFLVMWEWNFGEPLSGLMNTSNLENPTHTYAAPGIYKVQLKVYDNLFCFDTISHDVEIFPIPTADFQAHEHCAGELTSFLDLSTPNGAAITHWDWDFGDGGSLSYTTHVDSIPHLYALSGQYTVSLTVHDANGCSQTRTKIVNVFPLPTAQFQFSPSCAKQLTYFTDFSNGSGSQIITWNWNFGDPFHPGNTSDLQNPTHMYDTMGLYNVTLCVKNANNCVNCVTQSIMINPSPVADFTVDTTCVNTPTHFYNLSYCFGDIIVSWEWNFGDGSPSSNVQWPVHTYTSAGTFQVSLIVTSLNGCVSSIVKSVKVNERPVADFTYSMAGGPNCYVQGDSTHFTDLSTTTGGNVIISWNWDFGDGAYGNVKNPVHLYLNPGIYYVTLTVFDTNGCFNSIIKQIHLNPGPLASYTYSIHKCDSVSFLDASSGTLSPVQSWLWNFGDPGSGVNNFSTQKNPSHIYYTPVTETYSVTLTATDSLGCTDTIAHQIIISKPVPDFSFSDTLCLGTATQFTDESSSPGNLINSWFWDFGDPSSGLNNNSTLQNPLHIYSNVGSHFVTLTVGNENNCSAMIGKDVSVSYPPDANWDYQHPDCYPDSTHFIDMSLPQGSDPITSWHWDFGDGGTSTLKDPVHKYISEGAYPVTLTVYNSHGCQDYSVKPFFYYQGPSAGFYFDEPLCRNQIVFFHDISTASFGNILAWDWNFGDNSVHSNVPDPTHVFLTSGTFNVILTVTDDRGCVDSIQHPVMINALPVADFTADTTCLGIATQFTDNSIFNITAWQWDFGEPSSGGFNTSGLKNPTHTYGSPGDYFVHLTVTDNHFCFHDTLKKVTVVPVPNANFTNSSPCSGSAVQFTDESIIYQGTIIQWKWYFGDGTGYHYEQNPVHIFAGPGTYIVTLVVTTSGNCQPDSVTRAIIVHPAPIVAYTNSPPCKDEEVNFTDLTSQNGGTSLILWNWHFDDPLSGPDNNSQLQNPVHIFHDTGSYHVRLIVQNADNCEDTVIHLIKVKPRPGVDFSADTACVLATTSLP